MKDRSDRLSAWLSRRLGRPVEIVALRRLSGGAIQENWAVDVTVEGTPQALVVRTDSPSGISTSHGRSQEFALLRAAFQGGVTVPEPLWLETDSAVLGRPFFVMRRIAGETAGHKLVKDDSLAGERTALVARLGQELARIHAIRPPRADLAFLGRPADDHALTSIAAFREWLDAAEVVRPALEWGLRWLERHAPPPWAPVLCHNDFRTGNLMIDRGELTGVLDWEFAAWGDPRADLGWFCAPCWRFGRREAGREAGGLGPLADFLRGYEAESGRAIEPAELTYWAVLATARWCVIALQQASRHATGGETRLELALTGHLVPVLERDLLRMTGALADAADPAPEPDAAGERRLPADAEDLLETARKLLRDNLAPQLSGTARYEALMVANAMAIARRHQAAAPAAGATQASLADLYGDRDAGPKRLERRLASDLRSGAFDAADGRQSLVQRYLAQCNRAALLVSNPNALSD